MPDDELDQEQDVGAVLARMEAKIDSLESKLGRQLTPGQRAAEAREAMRRGYEQTAREREQVAGGEAA